MRGAPFSLSHTRLQISPPLRNWLKLTKCDQQTDLCGFLTQPLQDLTAKTFPGPALLSFICASLKVVDEIGCLLFRSGNSRVPPVLDQAMRFPCGGRCSTTHWAPAVAPADMRFPCGGKWQPHPPSLTSSFHAGAICMLNNAQLCSTTHWAPVEVRSPCGGMVTSPHIPSFSAYT